MWLRETAVLQHPYVSRRVHQYLPGFNHSQTDTVEVWADPPTLERRLQRLHTIICISGHDGYKISIFTSVACKYAALFRLTEVVPGGR
jgi:hypothetical protein